MLAKIIQETTDAVAAAVNGVDNVLDAVTDTVKGQAVNVLRSTGEVAGAGVESVASVANGAVKGVGGLGSSMADTVTGIMSGVVKGAGEVGGDVIGAVRGAAPRAYRDRARWPRR